MQQTHESGGNRSPLVGFALEMCETCLERGRERPGVHKVGSGWLCHPCWRGDGSSSEHSAAYDAPGQRKARRLYRKRNLEKFRVHQQRYRERLRGARKQ